MRKFHKTFLDLVVLNTQLKPYTKIIKAVVRNSYNNNRTLSVSQLIRYLEGDVAPMVVGNMKVRAPRKTAKKLRVVYAELKPAIELGRTRTDAVDMTELINAYRTFVMDDNVGGLRKKISYSLSKEGL